MIVRGDYVLLKQAEKKEDFLTLLGEAEYTIVYAVGPDVEGIKVGDEVLVSAQQLANAEVDDLKIKVYRADDIVGVL